MRRFIVAMLVSALTISSTQPVLASTGTEIIPVESNIIENSLSDDIEEVSEETEIADEVESGEEQLSEPETEDQLQSESVENLVGSDMPEFQMGENAITLVNGQSTLFKFEPPYDGETVFTSHTHVFYIDAPFEFNAVVYDSNMEEVSVEQGINPDGVFWAECNMYTDRGYYYLSLTYDDEEGPALFEGTLHMELTKLPAMRYKVVRVSEGANEITTSSEDILYCFLPDIDWEYSFSLDNGEGVTGRLMDIDMGPLIGSDPDKPFYLQYKWYNTSCCYLQLHSANGFAGETRTLTIKKVGDPADTDIVAEVGDTSINVEAQKTAFCKFVPDEDGYCTFSITDAYGAEGALYCVDSNNHMTRISSCSESNGRINIESDVFSDNTYYIGVYNKSRQNISATVNISPTTVQSLSLSKAENTIVYHVYGKDTEAYEETYYKYNELFKDGDTLTATHKDGTIEVFTFKQGTYDVGYWQDENGNSTDMIKVSTDQEQELNIGDTMQLTIVYKGVKISENITVIENPYVEISYIPAREVIYDKDLEYEYEFDGYGYKPVNGDKLEVRDRNDVIKIYTYTDGAFINGNEKLHFLQWDEPIRSYIVKIVSPADYHAQRPSAGDILEYTVDYFGLSCNFSMPIGEYPVQSIEYIPITKEILENTHGYYDTWWAKTDDGSDTVQVYEFYYQGTGMEAGDQLIVHYSDGQVKTYVLIDDVQNGKNGFYSGEELLDYSLGTVTVSTFGQSGYLGVGGKIHHRVKYGKITGEYTQTVVKELSKELKITKQPESVYAKAGKPVTFEVVAEGTGVTYQWEYQKVGETKWRLTSGGTDTVLNKTMRATWDGWKTRCVVTDSNGNQVISDVVTYNLKENLAILEQPVSAEQRIGTTVSFSVGAKGEELSYQWQFQKPGRKTWSNSGLASAKKSTLKFKMAEKDIDKKFRCIVTDEDGDSVISEEASLSLLIGPAILAQPADVDAAAGASVRISTVAEGTELKYRWQYQKEGQTSWTNSGLASATLPTLTFKMADSYDGRKFRCKITDVDGNVKYTNNALVTLVDGPAITKQPEDVEAAVGTVVYFNITATGEGLTYQWQYQAPGNTTWINSSLAGNKKNKLRVTASVARNGGKYRCVVMDEEEIVAISYSATLTVS